MFKEILQIIPKISPSDLNQMERSLGQRFGRIAKKFGKGLSTALLGGGIAGLALGLIDKVLNPLKETQEAIDRTLKGADDIVTNSKQFNTTAGKLARLVALGKSTGLDEGDLFQAMARFQTAVAEAKADPTKNTSVRNFVGQTDTAEAFFQFIQNLKKLSSDQQVLVQQEVFGQKAILKLADFLQTDQVKQSKLLGGPSSEKLTQSNERLATLNDEKDLLEARRGLNDTVTKARLITEDMIKAQDARERRALEMENRNVQAYDTLNKIDTSIAELGNLMKTVVNSLAGILVKFTNLAGNVQKLVDSPLAKGILKYVGGK